MEFLQYIRLMRKWLWLITVAAFVAGGAAFVTNAQRPDEYTTRATLIIGQYLQDPNPTAGTINVAGYLVQTYARIATSFEVLSAASTILNGALSPDQLRGLVRSFGDEGTNLLYIQVTYTDPFLAADIANAVAEALRRQSPGNVTPEIQAQIDFAREQVALLNEQLSQARLQLAQLDSQLAVAVTSDDQTEVGRLSEQRNTLVAQINQATSSAAQFNNTLATLQPRINTVEIFEQARIPSSAQRTSSLNAALAGAFAGAALAFGIALLVEYLDDTIRTTEQAAQTLAVPVLGAIARFGKRSDTYYDRLITQDKSMSTVAEGYRSLRTNLLFTSRTGRKPVFVFTSANPEEGKSLTCANLAITMALAGLQVVLIDADLRRPKLHEVFQLDNQVGLTTLLFADPLTHQQTAAAQHDESQMPVNLRQCLQSTMIPRLRVITSGFIPSNPSEILGSALMERWVDTLRSSTNIDVVIIDTPPCLMFADSSVLAATAKAEVVLVVDAGHTRREAALQAKEEFAKLGLEVKGVIVNRINPRDERGKYNYNYNYNYYYYTPRQTAQAAKQQSASGKTGKQPTVPATKK
jgi:capsular exopolysaccharide synthesis family protein